MQAANALLPISIHALPLLSEIFEDNTRSTDALRSRAFYDPTSRAGRDALSRQRRNARARERYHSRKRVLGALKPSESPRA